MGVAAAWIAWTACSLCAHHPSQPPFARVLPTNGFPGQDAVIQQELVNTGQDRPSGSLYRMFITMTSSAA